MRMSDYPNDSPTAVARLLALGVVVDGVPAEAEIQVLEQRGILAALGLTRSDFERIMDELCAELQRHSPVDAQGYVSLSPEALRLLLDDVHHPALRVLLVELLGEIFCADHRLAQGESILLREALAYWGETAFSPELLVSQAPSREQGRQVRAGQF